MPNATAWLIFDQNYWDKFGIFGITPGGEVPDYLHRADTSRRSWRRKIGVDEVGLLRTVERFNPDARRARDPQFHRGETLFDRYFGAYYPRLGKNSPDARFPAATAKARQRIAAAIGPVVSKLAGRAAKKNNPERAAVHGRRAPGEDHPPRAEEPEVERARARRHRAVLRPQGRGQRAGHRRRATGPTPAGARWTPRAASFRAYTPPATPAAPPPRASTEAPEGRSRSGWCSATWRDSKQPGGRKDASAILLRAAPPRKPATRLARAANDARSVSHGTRRRTSGGILCRSGREQPDAYMQAIPALAFDARQHAGVPAGTPPVRHRNARLAEATPAGYESPHLVQSKRREPFCQRARSCVKARARR